ncbi:MAG: DUF4897 domain-containing protein [Halanaeroarchaeum sp.]
MIRGKVVAVIVLGLLVGATVVPGMGTASGVGLAQPQDVDPDNVLISIDVQANGTAVWQIEYRVRLTTETEAYEDLVADVRTNRSEYLDRFANRMNATVEDAENYTGRAMTARDFGVTAEIRELPQQYGVLTYTFVWEGFAAVEDDVIRVGDALEGFFLDAETTLIVSWPASYEATSVSPAPTDERENAISWEGPLDFVDGEPRIVLEPEPTTTPPPTDTTDAVEGGSGTAWLLVAGVFVLLVLLGLAAVWYMRHEDGDESAAAVGSGQTDETPPSAGDRTATEAEDRDQDEPPEELLSNEERVTRFLDEHGGRAKQQEIVDGLGWTEAKTSQVLSSMAEEDEIEKFRIGRENVVKLPDASEEGEL